MKLSEKKKNEMAARCGYSEERCTDRIKEGIRQTEYDNDNEHAVKRKAIAELLDILETVYYEVFGRQLNRERFREFLNYNEEIEEIKTTVKDTNSISEDIIYEQ